MQTNIIRRIKLNEGMQGRLYLFALWSFLFCSFASFKAAVRVSISILCFVVPLSKSFEVDIRGTASSWYILVIMEGKNTRHLYVYYDN